MIYEFMHYPKPGADFELDVNRKYRLYDCPWGGMKALPNGFWLSDEDRDKGWLKFAAENMPDLIEGSLPVCVSVDTSDMLILDSRFSLDAKFFKPMPHDMKESIESWMEEASMSGDASDILGGPRPDWTAVSRAYSGIWVPAYEKGEWTTEDHRDYRWWHSWDCDSAVLWDLSAVAGVVHV